MKAPEMPADVQAHLARVLDSATFRGAERSRTLLRFVVEETLQGRAARLKDYTLGADALGRGEQFDPRTDPIARVEASRLRSRLDLYYATEGAADPLRISLPKGGYVPVFEVRRDAPGDAAVSGLRAAAERPARPLAWAGATLLTAAAGLAAVVAVGGWLLTAFGSSRAEPPESRLEITTPPTIDPVSLAVAPDGRAIAFVAGDGGVSRLWLRRLDAIAPRPLAGTDDGSQPFWAPDGRSIGFFADGRIKRLDLATGVVREVAAAVVPAGAAWSRGQVILHPVVPDSPLFASSLDGSPSRPITALLDGQSGHRGPALLPNGRRFLFYAAGAPAVRGVYVDELGGGTMRRLLDADTAAVVAPPDRLLYVQRGTLFAQRLDPRTASLAGPAIALADGIAVNGRVALPAVAAGAGTIVYRTGSAGEQRQLLWCDRRGTVLSRIGTPEANGPAYGSIAPDGRRLAVQRTLAGNTDIWLVDLERGASVRFTSEPQADIAPAWSPRGDRIVYASQVDGVFELFEKALDGTPARPLLRTGQSKNVTDWSRDGRVLLYRTVTVSPRADMDVWALTLDGARQPVPVVRTAFEERDAQFSPDGAWIAYQSNDSGQSEIYVQAFGRAGERVRISANGGVQARWRADGRELFYVGLDRQLTAVPVGRRADGGLQPGTPSPLFRPPLGAIQGVSLPSYVPSPDGQRFLLDAVVEQAAPPISIILNWKPPPT